MYLKLGTQLPYLKLGTQQSGTAPAPPPVYNLVASMNNVTYAVHIANAAGVLTQTTSVSLL